jgi:hypothetical protein
VAGKVEMGAGVPALPCKLVDILALLEMRRITELVVQSIDFVADLIPKPRSFDSLLHAFQWSN